MDDPLQPGAEVRLLSGVNATVVEDLGGASMVLVKLADGTPVRVTRTGLAAAAAMADR